MATRSFNLEHFNIDHHRQFEPYIRYIRFPFYKNLFPDTRLDFNYPITAIVGGNGTNKSSILKALYGAPQNNSTADFWFSTELDPIPDERHRFIYGYWNDFHRKVVEAIKMRIKNKEDPDYWEPARPSKQDHMEFELDPNVPPENQGASRTRWNQISKNVLYFDFRAELSAYDKYFYHHPLYLGGDSTKNRKEKKGRIRRASYRLRKSVSGEAKHYDYYRSQVKLNHMLGSEEVAAVSNILGRSYSGIQLLEHSYYSGMGYTAILQTNGRQYSEAVAGSGEFAVVRLVYEISKASEKSLILLDEPEVSLHPRAQKKLMDFIKDQVSKKYHQVIFCTHSPSLVEELPNKAIKVLEIDEVSGRVKLIAQETPANEAFWFLGANQSEYKVLVEDVLVKHLIEHSLKDQAFASIRDQVSISFRPGGAEAFFAQAVPSYVVDNQTNTLIVLDGDKKAKDDDNDVLIWPCSEDLVLPDDKSQKEKALRKIIKNLTDVDVRPVFIDGSNGAGNIDQKIVFYRDYLNWGHKYIRYLPTNKSPEEWLLELEGKPCASSFEAKKVFCSIARENLGLFDDEEIKSSDVLNEQRRMIVSIKNENPEIFQNLGENIRKFCSGEDVGDFE